MVTFRRMAALVLLLAGVLPAAAAQDPPKPSLVHKIGATNERLSITVNTSRILALDQKIPQAQVNNPEIVELHALSPNQVQIFGKNPGVTQVNLWGADQKIYTVDVIVYGDAQALTILLQSEFPNSAIKAVPVANGVLLSGYVDQPEHISRIVQIAEEYYPKVLNNMTVAGAQQVLLHVKVMEVSRTKLRALGFDFALFTNGATLVSGVSGLIASAGGGAITSTGGETLAFSVVSGGTSFFGLLEALRQDNLMKILAEPTLVTVSGRPAFFNCGGEFPILVPQSLGTVSIEYKKFGTQVDFVPVVLGQGRIHLDVRPRVSEIDNSRSVTVNGTTVPGLRVREVETGVEMMAGQTLAIAGLVQTREEAENRGLPWVSELPYVGAAFRRVQHSHNEIELLVLVTPELGEGVDAEQVPPCGPGMRTATPSDCELFLHGHPEVPKCCPPQGACPPAAGPMGAGAMMPTTPAMMSPTMPPAMSPPIPWTVPPPPAAEDLPPAAPETLLPPPPAPPGPEAQQSKQAARAGLPQAASHNRSNPQRASVPAATSTTTAEPRFLGPVGYDVK